jgi:hypothetical protein
MSKHYTFENEVVIEKMTKPLKVAGCSSVINQNREVSSKIRVSKVVELEILI